MIVCTYWQYLIVQKSTHYSTTIRKIVLIKHQTNLFFFFFLVSTMLQNLEHKKFKRRKTMNLLIKINPLCKFTSRNDFANIECSCGSLVQNPENSLLSLYQSHSFTQVASLIRYATSFRSTTELVH